MREVSSKNVNFAAYMHEKPSLQAIPFQSPSKIPQRSWGAVLGASWRAFSVSVNRSERSQNTCWQAIELSQKPQKMPSHLESHKTHKNSFANPPSLQTSRPPRLQASKPARAEAGCAKRKQFKTMYLEQLTGTN